MGQEFTANSTDIEWIERSPEESRLIEKPITQKVILNEGDENPWAHLVRLPPNATIGAHYHDVDQWQIILEGSCTIGDEHLEPFAVHYTDKKTAYGPIEAGDDGLTFMVLRPTPSEEAVDTDL